MADSPPHRTMKQSNPTIRDDAIAKANVATLRAKSGRPSTGLLLVGRQRIARTEHLDRICETLSTINAHVVRVRMFKDRSLPALLCRQIQDALQRVPATRHRQPPIHEALLALAGFAKSSRPKYPDIDTMIDLMPEPGIADSGVLELDMTSLFEAIGASAQQGDTAYAILIDEMHVVEPQQLSALVAALHRVAQRGLPMVLIGTGTPILRRRIGSAKPYAERMFEFIDLRG